MRPSRVFPCRSKRMATFGAIEGICPYALAFVNEVIDGAQTDAVVLTTTCDQMRRAADLIKRQSDIPVLLMNVPATSQTAASRDLYRSELKRLGRFLVRLGGRAPSSAMLASVMLEYDEARAKIRLASRDGVTSQYLKAVARFHRGDRLRFSNRRVASPHRRAAIAIVGGPLPYDEHWFVDAIERAGGVIGLDATENGERTLPVPFDRSGLRRSPMSELVRAYFDSIPDVFRRPNTRLYDWLADSFLERGIRGIILRHYVWCDLWRAEAQRLVEWTRLPVLHVDTEGGNLSRERTLSRIHAFLEMLR
jgi:benzoyl-CoA reductase/2-hydroxyglutaryl-CoA dehydratase subunit BcrC/BadD/HgdB